MLIEFFLLFLSIAVASSPDSGHPPAIEDTTTTTPTTVCAGDELAKVSGPESNSNQQTTLGESLKLALLPLPVQQMGTNCAPVQTLVTSCSGIGTISPSAYDDGKDVQKFRTCLTHYNLDGDPINHRQLQHPDVDMYKDLSLLLPRMATLY